MYLIRQPIVILARNNQKIHVIARKKCIGIGQPLLQ